MPEAATALRARDARPNAAFASWHAPCLGAGPEDIAMLSWAIAFFILALIAGVFGLTGIAGAAANVAWILFVVFLVLMIVAGLANALRGRPPV